MIMADKKYWYMYLKYYRYNNMQKNFIQYKHPHYVNLGSAKYNITLAQQNK